MNNQALNSVLKKNKERLIYNSIIFTSIIFVGVGLFSKLGKTGFALGITGFIPLTAFSLIFMIFLPLEVSDDIKRHHKVTKETIKAITTVTMPLILGTVLTGIGLFGDKLDSNVKFIAGVVGFVASSFSVLYSIVNHVKDIKQQYKLELKYVNEAENPIRSKLF